MSKLQMIKRANSTVSYSVNLPLAILRDLGWGEGDNLAFQIVEGKLIISLEEIKNGGN